MTPATIFTLVLLGLTLAVLASQKIRPDLTALIVMLLLIISGILSPGQAFSAFGQPVIPIIAGIYVLGAALYETGVATIVANQILRFGGKGEIALQLVIMLTAGVMSSVLSGLLVSVLLLPAVLRITRQTKMAPSRFLLPLVTAATIGNQLTLIGTTPNLVVNDILVVNGHESLGLFSLTPYGLASLAVMMVWYLLPGRLFLRRKIPIEPDQPSLEEVQQSYHLDNLLYRARVRSISDLIAQRLEDSQLRTTFKLNVVAAQSHEGKLKPVTPDWILEQDDILIIEGDYGQLLQAANMHGLELKGSVRLAEFNELEQETLRLAEVIVPFRSWLVGRSLAEVDFRSRYGLNVLAVHKQNRVIRIDLPELTLAPGDTLLVQGPLVRLRNLGADLVTVTDLSPQPGDLITSKAGLALAILGVMLVLVVSGLLSLATAIVGASVALILSGCLTAERAYKSIDLKIMVLVGGMLPLAEALNQTGAAKILAELIATAGHNRGPIVSLLILYLCASLITQVVSNSATAALMTPIALNLAATQGVSPAPFAIAMIFAVNTAYMTPMTDSNNLIVRQAGQYDMRDYLINNGPVFILQTLVILLMLAPRLGG